MNLPERSMKWTSGTESSHTVWFQAVRCRYCKRSNGGVRMDLYDEYIDWLTTNMWWVTIGDRLYCCKECAEADMGIMYELVKAMPDRD